MKNTFKNIDKITLVGVIIVLTVIVPSLVSLTVKVITTQNIIF